MGRAIPPVVEVRRTLRGRGCQPLYRAAQSSFGRPGRVARAAEVTWDNKEFVDNPDLDVQRRIIPMLSLESEAYPEGVRPLIPIAIEIARSHSDA